MKKAKVVTFIALLFIYLTNIAHAGRTSGGRVIRCEDADKTVFMQINPDFPKGSMMSLDGEAANIVGESQASDGELTYELSDGSALSFHATYDGQDFPAKLSKLGSVRPLTCRGETFFDNGW